MWPRGRGQLHPRQSLLGKVYYYFNGVPDVGLQLRAYHLTNALGWQFRPHRVLDAGCGSGRITLMLARSFPKVEIVGFDSDVTALVPARERQEYAGFTNVRFVSDPKEVVGTFDTIIATDVIAHVKDRDEFGRFLAAHAAPGTRLYLHTPTGEGKPHFGRFLDFDRQQSDRTVPFVTRPELTTWLLAHGFTPVKWVTTFRRWAGGLSWELSEVLHWPFRYAFFYPIWGLDAFLPTAGGGVLVVAERKAGP